MRFKKKRNSFKVLIKIKYKYFNILKGNNILQIVFINISILLKNICIDIKKIQTFLDFFVLFFISFNLKRNINLLIY